MVFICFRRECYHERKSQPFVGTILNTECDTLYRMWYEVEESSSTTQNNNSCENYGAQVQYWETQSRFWKSPVFAVPDPSYTLDKSGYYFRELLQTTSFAHVVTYFKIILRLAIQRTCCCNVPVFISYRTVLGVSPSRLFAASVACLVP